MGSDCGRYQAGANNVAVGTECMEGASGSTDGDYNCGLGYKSLHSITGGGGNVSIGYHTGADLTNGGNNTLVGREAGDSISTGDTNVCVGMNAGTSITTGTSNVCLGNQAGQNQITTEDYSLYISRNADAAGSAGTWIHGSSSGLCIQGNNSTAWSTTSDRRLKKNIVDSTKGLTEIDQLRVANFEYRKEDEIDMSEFPLADGPHQVCLNDESKEGVVQTGVIAQEVEAVLPECIRVSNKGAKTVQTDPIMWALVNAVKELSTKNDELAAEIASLKTQINN